VSNKIIPYDREVCKQERLPPVPVGVHAYVDTVAIWLEKKPSNNTLKSLKGLCGHRHVKQGSPQWNDHLRCWLQLHQPSVAGLRTLEESPIDAESSFLVNQVDLALDLTVANLEARDRLYVFLDKHLVKRWHGKQTVKYCKTTRYSGPRLWPSHQLDLYPDQSRIDGRLCIHLEWRAHGKVKVEGLGIYNLGQLIDFDHRAFWQRHLCLKGVDYTALGRTYTGRGNAKKPICRGAYSDFDRHVGELIGRAAAQSENGPTTQDVRDWCRDHGRFRPASCIRPISNESYLPQKAL